MMGIQALLYLEMVLFYKLHNSEHRKVLPKKKTDMKKFSFLKVKSFKS